MSTKRKSKKPKKSKKTIADVYREAEWMLHEELKSLTGKLLSPTEENRVNRLADVIAASVLKEMGIGQ